MSFLKNKSTLIALSVLCWAIATTFLASYYYLQFNDLSAKVTGTIISTNLGVNYGNGSGIYWFNDTKTIAGSTLLSLTKLVASVNYTDTGLFTGSFVNGINGQFNSGSYAWIWWSSSSFGWSFGTIASDKYIVGENETLLWYYQNITTFPPPPPT